MLFIKLYFIFLMSSIILQNRLFVRYYSLENLQKDIANKIVKLFNQ